MKQLQILWIGITCFWTGTLPAFNVQNDTLPTDSSFFIVSQIHIVGNTKTKEKIITREIPFHVGDTLFAFQLETIFQHTKNNLFNTSLFNFIRINTVTEYQNFIKIFIVVEERWYLWPYIIFEQADRNMSSFLHNKDWSRVNYGLMLVKNNFRGKRETLKFKIRLGYKEQLQLYYQTPFFLGSANHGVTIEANGFRLKETQFATHNNKPQLFKDYSAYSLNYQNTLITYTYRNSLYQKHHFTAIYNHVSISDTIVKLNPDYLGNKKQNLNYFSFLYAFSFDKRNYKFYPTSGFNFDVVFTQKGFSLLANELPGITEFEVSAYRYVEFTNRWYAGYGGMLKFTSPYKQPYFIERALGYENSLRGFEYYLIDGQHFETSRAFIKYALIPFNVRQMESVGWEKFSKIHYSLFLNAFFDQGYVYDVQQQVTNQLSNSMLYSFGLGIDLVAYYDLIFRFEYTMNHLKEHGFFFNVGKAF